jgi:hypothetical protein
MNTINQTPLQRLAQLLVAIRRECREAKEIAAALYAEAKRGKKSAPDDLESYRRWAESRAAYGFIRNALQSLEYASESVEKLEDREGREP